MTEERDINYQDFSLKLKKSSWENLFEVIRSNKTSLDCKGNFWASVQYLESQLKNKLKGDNEDV